MSKTNNRYMLIRTDGYSIFTNNFPNKQAAQTYMQDEYKKSYPEDPNDFCKTSSHCDELDAILYKNCENVFVWKIVQI